MYGETYAVCQVYVLYGGLSAHPRFKPVITPCLFVAGTRVVVAVALDVERLTICYKRSWGDFFCGPAK